jgi:hypothetical protein
LDDGDLLHALLAAARALRDVDREGFRQGLHPREPVAPSLWSPPSSPMALVRAGEAGTTSRRSSERGAKQPK